MPSRSDRFVPPSVAKGEGAPAKRGRGLGGLVLSTAILLVVTAPPARAAEITSSSTVIVRPDDVRSDDIYAAALRVIISGTVQGDLVAFAAEEIIIDGNVTGSVVALAPTVIVEGRIGQSLRAVAGTVRVDGELEGDLVTAAWTIRLGSESSIGGDVVVWTVDMSALGDIGGRLEGTQRTLRLAGSIGEAVDISVGTLSVVGGLSVAGDFGYRSEVTASGLEQAEVEGVIVRRSPLPPNVRVRSLVLFGRFLAVLVTASIALTLAYAWPGRAEAAVKRAGASPLRAWIYGAVMMVSPLVVAGVGVLALALAPPAASLPLVVALMPVILALLGLVLVVSLVAGMPAVGWAGGVLFKRLGLHGAVLAGSLLAGALWMIPYIGWLVPVVALPLGLGAWMLTLFARSTPRI